MCADGSSIHVRRTSKGSHLGSILYEDIQSQKLRTQDIKYVHQGWYNGLRQIFQRMALLGAIRAFQIESHSELLQVMRSCLLSSAL